MSRRRGPQLPKAAQATQPASLLPAHEATERVRRLVTEGTRLLSADRPVEAAELLAQARSLDPANAAAAINLGGALILQGKYSRAVPVLEEAVHLAPEDAMVWSNLAAAYLGKLALASDEQQQRAIEAYQRALALDPAAPGVHYNLGLIHLDRRDLPAAAEHFRHALQSDPNDRDARLWLERLRRGERGDKDRQG